MSQWVRVADVNDIPPGKCQCVVIDELRLALFNVGGTFYATEDSCSHQGGPLSQGTLDGTTIICPWHAATFDVTTGETLGPPARMGVIAYPTRVQGRDVLVEI